MRIIKNINDNWFFLKEKHDFSDVIKDENKINLPYTWNGDDGQDGGNDYWRGKATFVRRISKDELTKNDVIYIEFNGVNSECDVYVNGKHLIRHEGGYSTFRVLIPNDLIKEENELLVLVDNTPNDYVYPQAADFTFYGGIYRDVNIISVPKDHFCLDFYGSKGLKITPRIEGNDAVVEFESWPVSDKCEVLYEIFDNENKLVEAKTTNENTVSNLKIENVHLWNGRKDPFLYKAVATLIAEGEEKDRVETKFGCRTFSIDPDKGFFLNGNEYPLRGVSRHQDRPHIGNALTKKEHEEDIDLIFEVGATTIRLAHYQHSQDFYDLCDEKGLVIWAEIPYISNHLDNGLDNTISQMKELVYQNYNHPSIVVWGLSNEITMAGSTPKLLENHKILNDLVHDLDKTRLTTVAVVTMCPDTDPYIQIPDVVSYNHYFGWYGGDVSMYGPWFDNFHKKYPHLCVGLSEYGCEALKWHTSKPEAGDYSEEYQSYYHEEMIKQIMERPYLWATHVWNMFDFAADARAEGGEEGINHKGLVSFDRKYKKDSFYAYKAWLSDEPVLHLCSKNYIDRVEDKTKVTVYSNQEKVELYLNGELFETKEKDKTPFFYFEVPNVGETKVLVKAGDLKDEGVIRKVDKFNEEYVMKGTGLIINWFDVTAPEGYYSINDTIGDLMKSFRGKIKLLSMVKMILGNHKKSEDGKKNKNKSVMGMNLKGNKTIMTMAKAFPIKRAFMMAGKNVTKEEVLEFNKKLNKIKKKTK